MCMVDPWGVAPRYRVHGADGSLGDRVGRSPWFIECDEGRYLSSLVRGICSFINEEYVVLRCAVGKYMGG